MDHWLEMATMPGQAWQTSSTTFPVQIRGPFHPWDDDVRLVRKKRKELEDNSMMNPTKSHSITPSPSPRPAVDSEIKPKSPFNLHKNPIPPPSRFHSYPIIPNISISYAPPVHGETSQFNLSIFPGGPQSAARLQPPAPRDGQQRRQHLAAASARQEISPELEGFTWI